MYVFLSSLGRLPAFIQQIHQPLRDVRLLEGRTEGTLLTSDHLSYVALIQHLLTPSTDLPPAPTIPYVFSVASLGL